MKLTPGVTVGRKVRQAPVQNRGTRSLFTPPVRVLSSLLIFFFLIAF